MANIHFPVDGQGTQALKNQNKNKENPFHVDAVTPDAKNQNKSSGDDAPSNLPKHEADNLPDSNDKTATEQQTSRQKAARGIDRRKGNRRSENVPVLLNTRSEQDRRKKAGQREDDANDPANFFGIDTEA